MDSEIKHSSSKISAPLSDNTLSSMKFVYGYSTNKARNISPIIYIALFLI